MTSHTPNAAPTRRPGRPRQDESQAAEVRERLLDAATEITIEHGFDSCGLREIAARADVSSGMVAYYFGDRRGLYDAMLTRALERVSAQIVAHLADGDPNDGDWLDGLVRIQVAALAADPWLPQLILREIVAASDPDARARLAELVGDGPLRRMITWLDEAKASGTVRADLDTQLMALTLGSLSAFPFLMLPTVGERIGLSIDEDFPERLVEHNLKLLNHGIRARPEDKP